MLGSRQKRIQQFLYTNSASSIQVLIEYTGSLPATVRRELARLEELGAVQRTHGDAVQRRHGGAVLTETHSLEAAFSLREHEQLGAKRAIACLAYEHLEPGASVLMD